MCFQLFIFCSSFSISICLYFACHFFLSSILDYEIGLLLLFEHCLIQSHLSCVDFNLHVNFLAAKNKNQPKICRTRTSTFLNICPKWSHKATLQGLTFKLYMPYCYGNHTIDFPPPPPPPPISFRLDNKTQRMCGTGFMEPNTKCFTILKQ